MLNTRSKCPGTTEKHNGATKERPVPDGQLGTKFGHTSKLGRTSKYTSKPIQRRQQKKQ